jgi:hypothetical protein
LQKVNGMHAFDSFSMASSQAAYVCDNLDRW